MSHVNVLEPPRTTVQLENTESRYFVELNSLVVESGRAICQKCSKTSPQTLSHSATHQTPGLGLLIFQKIFSPMAYLHHAQGDH